MNRLEALADAIASINGYRIPESPIYQARNPLALKEFEGGMSTDRLRKFGSLLGGYGAALYDLKVKCSGESKAKLHDQPNLKGLVRVYSMPDLSAQTIAKFLRKALDDETIKETTELSYFIG